MGGVKVVARENGWTRVTPIRFITHPTSAGQTDAFRNDLQTYVAAERMQAPHLHEKPHERLHVATELPYQPRIAHTSSSTCSLNSLLPSTFWPASSVVDSPWSESRLPRSNLGALRSLTLRTWTCRNILVHHYHRPYCSVYNQDSRSEAGRCPVCSSQSHAQSPPESASS